MSTEDPIEPSPAAPEPSIQAPEQDFAKLGAEKKVAAGVLGILLGALGVHKFYLGYTKEGVIMLVATIVLAVVTCGMGAWVVWVIGLVEGILYLTKQDEEFGRVYVAGRKPWF